MKVVQDRLNHASERITADIYTHVRAPMQSDAAMRVASLLLPNGEMPNASGSADTTKNHRVIAERADLRDN